MAVSLKHKFASAKSDSLDTTRVQPSNWNDEHDLTIAANSVLGRGTGAGQVQELPAGTVGRDILAATTTAEAIAASGAASLAQAATTTTVGAAIHAATAKTPIVDADTIGIIDSVASNVLKKITFANLKVSLKALASDVYAAVSNKFLTTDMIETASAYVSLTDAANITIDWNEGINFTVTLAGSRTLANPTNGQPGTYRTVLCKGSDATDRPLAFGNQYLGAIPTITNIDNTRWYDVTIKCITPTHFTVSATLALGSP